MGDMGEVQPGEAGAEDQVGHVQPRKKMATLEQSCRYLLVLTTKGKEQMAHQHYKDVEHGPGCGFSAMELADAHIEDMEITDPEEAQRVRELTMMAAEYLHETGATGCWEQLDPPGFFERIAFMSRRQQEAVALAMLGFYVWLSAASLIQPEVAEEIAVTLARMFPESSVLRNLSLSAQKLCRRLSKQPRQH